MSLENAELAKNLGELIKDVGLSLKSTSEGGTKIVIKEWIEMGAKFATNIGADFIDEDED